MPLEAGPGATRGLMRLSSRVRASRPAAAVGFERSKGMADKPIVNVVKSFRSSRRSCSCKIVGQSRWHDRVSYEPMCRPRLSVRVKPLGSWAKQMVTKRNANLDTFMACDMRDVSKSIPMLQITGCLKHDAHFINDARKPISMSGWHQGTSLAPSSACYASYAGDLRCYT